MSAATWVRAYLVLLPILRSKVVHYASLSELAQVWLPDWSDSGAVDSGRVTASLSLSLSLLPLLVSRNTCNIVVHA